MKSSHLVDEHKSHLNIGISNALAKLAQVGVSDGCEHAPQHSQL